MKPIRTRSYLKHHVYLGTLGLDHGLAELVHISGKYSSGRYQLAYLEVVYMHPAHTLCADIPYATHLLLRAVCAVYLHDSLSVDGDDVRAVELQLIAHGLAVRQHLGHHQLLGDMDRDTGRQERVRHERGNRHH